MNGLPEGFYILEDYVRDHPDEKLISGVTILGKFYVRPLNWAGMWKQEGNSTRLAGGNCLAYFDTLEELDNKIISLGLEILV